MRLVRIPGPILTIFLVPMVQAQRQDMRTPVVGQPMQPSTFALRETDDKQHFVYELMLTHTGTAPATVEELEDVCMR